MGCHQDLNNIITHAIAPVSASAVGMNTQISAAYFWLIVEIRLRQIPAGYGAS